MNIKVRDGYVKWDLPGVYKGSITSCRVTVRIVSCKGSIYHDSFRYGSGWILEVEKGEKYEGKTIKSGFINDRKKQTKRLFRYAKAKFFKQFH